MTNQPQNGAAHWIETELLPFLNNYCDPQDAATIQGFIYRCENKWSSEAAAEEYNATEWIKHDGSGMPVNIKHKDVIELYGGSKYGQQAQHYNWNFPFTYRIIEPIADKPFAADTKWTKGKQGWDSEPTKPALIEPLGINPVWGESDRAHTINKCIAAINWLLNNGRAG